MYDVIELYPTNKYDYKCTCFVNDEKEREWSLGRTETILASDIFEKVSKEIKISGGEPTQWEYLIDFIYALRKKNSKVKISLKTNGIRLTRDSEYRTNFIECCKENKILVDILLYNPESLGAIHLLNVEKLIRDVYVIPTSSKDFDDLKSLFDVLSKYVKTSWYLSFPSIKYKHFYKKLLSFVEEQSKNSVKWGRRCVNKKTVCNYELIKSSLDTKDFYKKYECKCGKNLIIYTDGKSYHCLSQAIHKVSPFSLKTPKELTWIKCKCDMCHPTNIFELREKK